MTQSFIPPVLPAALTSARNWLVWRLVHKEGQPKPSKIPYYVSGPARPGTQGTPEDRALLASFDEAVAAVERSQTWERPYTGVGFAPLDDCGIVALDFDDCVQDGVIAPHVEPICEGSYTEFSPSGTGVRAFFAGSLLSRKDVGPTMRGPWGIEVFGHNGFVTVTGNVTPTCAMWGHDQVVAPLTPAVLAMYAARGWDASRVRDDVNGDALMALEPTLGWSEADVRNYLADLPDNYDYDTWVKVGMAVHHETSGTGFELWHAWSKASPKYTTEKYCHDRWASFGRGSATITGRWLLKMRSEAISRKRYKAHNEWKTRLAECQDEFKLREELVPKIVRDAALGEFERDQLAQALQEQLKSLGTKLPITACRALLKPAVPRLPTVQRDRPLTEFGMAERMLDRFSGELMFVPEMESWYLWTGIYWRTATDVEIEHRAKETVRALNDERDDHDTADFWEFCKSAQQARMVRNMVSLASSDPRVMVPAAELDRQSHLLGVQNGVVDLTSGHLIAPDQEYRITKVTGCDYVATARAPLFEQTLSEVFNGDTDMVDFFHRSIGYTAMGRPTEDILFIPFGNGANGKSTVLGTIRRAFGAYARAAEASSFVSDSKSGASAGGAREDLLRLKGARFVFVNEPDENSELREGAVKSMTGGDAITARGLYAKSSVEIVPSWVVFMPTNHKPIVKGSDNGIWRRLTLLPFTRNFEADPTVAKDPRREEKLTAELPGVLAWMVRGALAYQQKGLVQPRSVAAARDSYRAQMDLLAEWLEDCCEIAPGLQEESNRLWLSWEQFAKNRGIIQYVKSSVALGRRLDMRFPAAKGSRGVRIRKGLRVRAPFSEIEGGNEAGGVAGVAVDDLFS
jgi:putative DNA primase/helicase